jgi:hypothetical protein
MKKLFIGLVFGWLLIMPFQSVSCVTATAVSAPNVSGQLNAALDSAGYDTATTEKPIKTILGLLGIVFLGLTVYAGAMLFMAGGNDDNVTKAKSTLMTAIIGLVIILSAYAITQFAYKIATGYYDDMKDAGSDFDIRVEPGGIYSGSLLEN